MKTSFLAIALAVATLPFTFAAQVPPANNGASATGSKVQTKSIKKHHKKNAAKKAAAKSGGTATVSK